MDRRLGRPLPCQLSNPTRAHPCAINLWLGIHADSQRYAVLASVSGRYPPHKGRLLTRYSPVRHCLSSVLLPIQSVRLECVMHAASVHPEPGSNSRMFCIISLSQALQSSSSFFFALLLLLCLCFLFGICSSSTSHFCVCFVLLSSRFSLLCCSIFNDRCPIVSARRCLRFAAT